MISFKDYLEEENNIGYEGTDKLTQHRKKMTPGEKPVTPNMLPNMGVMQNKRTKLAIGDARLSKK